MNILKLIFIVMYQLENDWFWTDRSQLIVNFDKEISAVTCVDKYHIYNMWYFTWANSAKTVDITSVFSLKMFIC